MRVLIVDDEPPGRALLERILAGMVDVEVAGSCASGREAVERIRAEPIDLVLLDIRMPGMDGFDVIEEIGPDRMPAVVFVTAHEQHTLRAFEVHALDYVMKPCDPARIRAAVDYVRRRRVAVGDRAPAVEWGEQLRGMLDEVRKPGAARYATRLTVRTDDGAFFVRPDDVDWLEASGNYVLLHVGADAHPVRVTLRHLLDRLDPATFVRIHRSSAVNLDRVASIHRWFGGDYQVELTTGETLRVSRTYRDELLKLSH